MNTTLLETFPIECIGERKNNMELLLVVIILLHAANITLAEESFRWGLILGTAIMLCIAVLWHYIYVP